MKVHHLLVLLTMGTEGVWLLGGCLCDEGAGGVQLFVLVKGALLEGKKKKKKKKKTNKEKWRIGGGGGCRVLAGLCVPP